MELDSALFVQQFLHQRLIAMMPAAEGDTVLIGVRGEIVWMRPVRDKPDEPPSLHAWTEGANAGEMFKSLERSQRELLVVRENAITPDALEVINRCG